jgi:hypothetical protein
MRHALLGIVCAALARSALAGWSASVLKVTTYTIAIDSENARRLYAGVATGLFESEDAGATWRQFDITPALPPATAVVIDPKTLSTLSISPVMSVETIGPPSLPAPS